MMLTPLARHDRNIGQERMSERDSIRVNENDGDECQEQGWEDIACALEDRGNLVDHGRCRGCRGELGSHDGFDLCCFTCLTLSM